MTSTPNGLVSLDSTTPVTLYEYGCPERQVAPGFWGIGADGAHSHCSVGLNVPLKVVHTGALVKQYSKKNGIYYC